MKGTKTKDLKSITEQAFGYKANQKGCVYVITSNYEKLRFYINDATEYLEFNLFTLTETDFELLYLCTSKESIFLDLPQKIKTESIVKEEQITKDFYKDYSLFKRELYRDLVKLNAKNLKTTKQTELAEASLEDEQLQKELVRLEKNVKLALFKKSQKLIDRFLFIFFAEDRGLLPPNSTVKILKDWILKDKLTSELLNKLKDNLSTIGEIFENQFLAGIKTGSNKLFIYSLDEVKSITRNSELEKKYLKNICSPNSQ